MCSRFEAAAMAVELRRNTSKSSFESSASGNKLRTHSNFVSTLHSRSPSQWKQSGNEEETRSNFPTPESLSKDIT
jgi:hypothetical protein